MSTLSTPAFNLRQLMARLEGLERKVSNQWHPIEPQQETGDASTTDFHLPAGARPNLVLVGTTPQVRGDSDDYTVENNGENLFIRFAVAPGSSVSVIITREAQR